MCLLLLARTYLTPHPNTLQCSYSDVLIATAATRVRVSITVAVSKINGGAGERAVEALKEMDQQIVPWFQSAAGELLKDMPAEKALALALAKITGNTELKVTIPTFTFCIAQR